MVSTDLFTFSLISGGIPHRQTVGRVVGAEKSPACAVFSGDSGQAALNVVGIDHPALSVVGVA